MFVVLVFGDWCMFLHGALVIYVFCFFVLCVKKKRGLKRVCVVSWFGRFGIAF